MSALKGFLKGLLFGSAVGGVVTLLTTEKSGKENRNAIKETMDESISKINDVTASYQRVQNNQIILQETMKKTIPAFKEGIEKDLAAFEFQAQPRLARIREQLEKLKSQLASNEKLD